MLIGWQHASVPWSSVPFMYFVLVQLTALLVLPLQSVNVLD